MRGLVLHGYFRSSCSYRVRIALNLKQLDYRYVPVHVGRGEQHDEAFLKLNPGRAVPVLIDEGIVITQSLAIIEYLDERYAKHPLLPDNAVARARVRAMALAIACDVQPVTNLRVLNYLTDTLQVADDDKAAWSQHWNRVVLGGLEQQLAAQGHDSPYLFGDTPTMADCCLIPALFNARRFGVDVDAYPGLLAVEARCLALEAFAAAHPDRQADAPQKL